MQQARIQWFWLEKARLVGVIVDAVAPSYVVACVIADLSIFRRAIRVYDFLDVFFFL